MISVLFPTRKRPDWLKRATESLVTMADDPSQVEVLAGCDPDDLETLTVRTHGLSVWVAPERYGYAGTHHYMNAMVKHAQGEWLMLWCDQAEMLTKGWDTIIGQQQQGVWYPDASPGYRFDITPIWPKAWADALGHVAPFNHIDTYIQRLGEALGCHEMLPIRMIHNSAHINDLPEDDTYREGRGPLGPYGMTGPLPAEQLEHDITLIREKFLTPA